MRFAIWYKSGSYFGPWTDPNIRGNREPLTYHDESNANKECEFLNCQFNNEDYSFSVVPTPEILDVA